MDFEFELDRKGYIKRRETSDLEYKENFHFGENLLKCLKTLIGMANNRGGQIIFGIKDTPHLPIGMTNKKFREVDPATIDCMIRDYFSSELEWEMHTLEHNGLEFGQLTVKEAKHKPVICKKQKDGLLREAAIYYRYRAITKEIEFAELQNILKQEKEKETKLWIEHIREISLIGPQNVRLLDIVKSEIKVGNGSILIDKNIIDQIKFIKEGEFDEVNGAPTLKLVGEIDGITDLGTAIPSDMLYPYFSKDLQEKLSINNYELKCMIWKLDIKGNRRFHTEVKAGNNSRYIQKYSEATVNHILNFLEMHGFLSNCTTEYKSGHLSKKIEK